MECWEEVEEEEEEEEEKEEGGGRGKGKLIGQRDLPYPQVHAQFAVATGACSCLNKR